MPIYAYKCESCGFRQDVLQKISDPALSTCPSCGAQSFAKQVTAAGFQLKGSGWYVTDFRGGGTAEKAEKSESKPAESKPVDGAGATSTPAAAADKPAATPADKSGPPSSEAA